MVGEGGHFGVIELLQHYNIGSEIFSELYFAVELSEYGFFFGFVVFFDAEVISD
jgi:hypothetical protein